MAPLTSPTHPTEWPADGLEYLDACPVCTGLDAALLHTAVKDYFFRSPGIWTLWQCKDCGAGFLNPRPTVSTLGLAYDQYYTHHETTAGPPGNGIKNRVRRWIGNSYRASQYGAPYSDPLPRAPWLILAFPRLRCSVDRAFRYIGRPSSVRVSKLLDIGCGNGEFLRKAKLAGWDARGSDPDPAAVATARELGVEVRTGGAEAWEDCESEFDIITLNHVLEHVHSPALLVSQAQRLLKPGGTLFIETPNLDALGHEIHGQYWRGLEVPRHLCLFTRCCLVSLLEREGYNEVTFRRRPSPFHKLSALSITAARDDGKAGKFKTLTRVRRQDESRSEFLTVTCSRPLQ